MEQEMLAKLREGRWPGNWIKRLAQGMDEGRLSVLSVSSQDITYLEEGEEKKALHPDAKWSVFQRDVFREVSFGRGHLIVRARAGAGKTSTLVEACKRLPEGTRALACAFNKEIERELASRIQGDPARNVGVDVMTLHSLGFRAVKKAWGKCEADNKDTWTEDYLKSLPRQAPRGAIKKIASLAKSMLLNSSASIFRMANSRGLWPETMGPREDQEILRQIVGLLDNSVKRHAMIGFDDMVYVAARLGLTAGYFNVVFVDETQDMSASQLCVARNHLRNDGRMVLIGDDRQCIYSFRGADSDGIDRMQKELSAKVLPLSISYRCARKIVELAATVVPDFKASDEAIDGEVVSLPAICLDKTWKEGDAVISRANAPLVKLCLAAIRSGRKARVNGREIGQEIARIVKQSGARTVEELLKYMAGWRDDALAKLPKAEDEDDRALEEASQRIFDIYETVLCLAEGLSTVDQVLARIEDIFADKSGKDVLLFSSTHKAKGLEWERVFMLTWTYRPSRGQEEENLWYVAVTRAKKSLYLVSESS